MIKAILVSLSLSTISLTACTDGGGTGTGGGPIGGGTSAREACEDVAITTCARLYECISPEDLQLAGFPETEAGCADMLSLQNCRGITNDNACEEDGGTFDPAKADLCLQQISDATCEALLGEEGNDVTPACEQVCN